MNWQLPPGTRTIAEYSSAKGAWIVCLVEAAVLGSLIAACDESLHVHVISASSPEQGLRVARRMIARQRNSTRACAQAGRIICPGNR